jgi:hypothetical protein
MAWTAISSNYRKSWVIADCKGSWHWEELEKQNVQ